MKKKLNKLRAPVEEKRLSNGAVRRRIAVHFADDDDSRGRKTRTRRRSSLSFLSSPVPFPSLFATPALVFSRVLVASHLPKKRLSYVLPRSDRPKAYTRTAPLARRVFRSLIIRDSTELEMKPVVRARIVKSPGCVAPARRPICNLLFLPRLKEQSRSGSGRIGYTNGVCRFSPFAS